MDGPQDLRHLNKNRQGKKDSTSRKTPFHNMCVSMTRVGFGKSATLPGPQTGSLATKDAPARPGRWAPGGDSRCPTQACAPSTQPLPHADQRRATSQAEASGTDLTCGALQGSRCAAAVRPPRDTGPPCPPARLPRLHGAAGRGREGENPTGARAPTGPAPGAWSPESPAPRRRSPNAGGLDWCQLPHEPPGAPRLLCSLVFLDAENKRP